MKIRRFFEVILMFFEVIFIGVLDLLRRVYLRMACRAGSKKAKTELEILEKRERDEWMKKCCEHKVVIIEPPRDTWRGY